MDPKAIQPFPGAADLVAAIDANAAAYVKQFDGWPPYELHDTPQLLWAVTPFSHPLFNQALRARFDPQTDPEAIDATLKAVIDGCRARDIGLQWIVGPGCQPRDLGQRLARLGLWYWDQALGMALDLETLASAPPAPSLGEAIDIAPVAGAADLEAWLTAAGEGFGLYELVLSHVGDMMVHGVLAPQPALLRLYVARVRGEAVGTASILLADGVAGLYWISTRPAWRQMGIGTALVRHVLYDARREGYRVAILHATDSGAGLYRRLGFRAYASQDNYVLLPNTS